MRIEIGSRARSQPAPAAVVHEALTRWHRPGARAWLALLPDEQEPEVLEAAEPGLVVWGTLWPRRPDVQVRFDLTDGVAGGCLVRWTLLVDPPAPDQSLTGHLRKRVNQLINADLRCSFGQ